MDARKAFIDIPFIPYKLHMDIYNYIMEVWRKQGKTSKYTCTGMSSFSYLDVRRITFDAASDALIKAEDYLNGR